MRLAMKIDLEIHMRKENQEKLISSVAKENFNFTKKNLGSQVVSTINYQYLKFFFFINIFNPIFETSNGETTSNSIIKFLKYNLRKEIWETDLNLGQESVFNVIFYLNEFMNSFRVYIVEKKHDFY